MSRRKSLYLVPLLAGIVMTGLAPPAMASFRLRIEDTGANVGVVLTGTEVPGNNPSGSITFSGAIGAFSVVVTTTVTAHSSPNNVADLDLNNITVIGSGPGTLRITAEDTGYTRGTNPFVLQGTVGGTLTGPAGTTDTIQSWANGTNLVPDLGADAGTTSTAVSLASNPLGAIPSGSTKAWNPAFVASPGAFSSTSTNSFTSGPPTNFSLFVQTTLVFTGAGSTSFNEEQQAFGTPAPQGLVLALSALPVLGAFWLRRRLKTVSDVAAA
jgi:hypothetical protein